MVEWNTTVTPKQAISVLMDCADSAAGTWFEAAYRMGADAIRATHDSGSPLMPDELRYMDGEPVYYAWDNIGWSKVVVVDGSPYIAAIINHGEGYECALYTPTDIEGNSYAYRRKPE